MVELDQHPLGNGIQNLLDKTTGRRTVPNILINGKSVGGGDDIEAMEIAGTLVEKIQYMGGKRITKLEKLREGMSASLFSAAGSSWTSPLITLFDNDLADTFR